MLELFLSIGIMISGNFPKVNFPKVTSYDQDTSTISVSAPVCSVSTDCGSESPSKQRGPQAEEFSRNSKKLRHGKGGRSGLLSPGSAASLRRSPRFKVIIAKHPDFNNKSVSLYKGVR